jgi:predicted helicase
VDSFLSESSRPEFAFRLLIATTDRIGKTAERTLQAQAIPAGRLLLGDLQTAQVSWPRSLSDLRPAKLRPKHPRPHQREAVTDVVRGFGLASRGQMIMALREAFESPISRLPCAARSAAWMKRAS